MLDAIIQWDKILFLYLNGLHFDFLDPIMDFLSNNFILLIFFIALFLFDYFKSKGAKQAFMAFVFIIFSFILSDVISTKILKDNVKRPRPCYTKEIKTKVHSVGSCFGGRYGFVSSHASNSMALAVILSLMALKRKRLFKFLIPYSFLISYSRIYVGKHYPLDIIFGMLLGLLIALTLFKIKENLFQKRH